MDGNIFKGVDKAIYVTLLVLAFCCFGSGFLVAKFF